MASTKDCVAFIVAWLRANPHVLPMESSFARAMSDPSDSVHVNRFGPWLWKRVAKKSLPNGDTLRVFHAPAHCYLYNLALGLTEDYTGAIVGLEHGPLQYFHDKYAVRFASPDLARYIQTVLPTMSNLSP